MFVLKFSGLQYIFSATDWQVVLLLNLPSINIGLYLPFFFLLIFLAYIACHLMLFMRFM
jgi:hypothetical protein